MILAERKARPLAMLALAGLLALTLAPPGAARATPSLPSAPHAARAPTQMVIYDWNRPVTVAERGFPRDRPPRANGNWRTPVNFADGTLYFRAQIKSQPVPQQMRLQFCFWQDGVERETCGPLAQVSGARGTVVTWSVPIRSMWRKGGVPIDWSRPRAVNGVAIKDMRGRPISDYLGWRWNGANPRHWYPLNMRFTVVVVAKGAEFSGWGSVIR